MLNQSGIGFCSSHVVSNLTLTYSRAQTWCLFLWIHEINSVLPVTRTPISRSYMGDQRYAYQTCWQLSNIGFCTKIPHQLALDLVPRADFWTSHTICSSPVHGNSRSSNSFGTTLPAETKAATASTVSLIASANASSQKYTVAQAIAILGLVLCCSHFSKSWTHRSCIEINTCVATSVAHIFHIFEPIKDPSV